MSKFIKFMKENMTYLYLGLVIGCSIAGYNYGIHNGEIKQCQEMGGEMIRYLAFEDIQRECIMDLENFTLSGGINIAPLNNDIAGVLI